MISIHFQNNTLAQLQSSCMIDHTSCEKEKHHLKFLFISETYLISQSLGFIVHSRLLTDE